MKSKATRNITLGGGCFWCTEAVFERVNGVLAVESGYSNGELVAPTYEQVCSGQTGHAEVVTLIYDPRQISLREILEIFFVVHDPTTLNRQGNDIGAQFRSGIYVDGEAVAAVARQFIAEAERAGTGPVVTEVCRRHNYARAEEFHQHFFANHPNADYCSCVVASKVQKLQQAFARLVKGDAEPAAAPGLRRRQGASRSRIQPPSLFSTGR